MKTHKLVLYPFNPLIFSYFNFKLSFVYENNNKFICILTTHHCVSICWQAQLTHTAWQLLCHTFTSYSTFFWESISISEQFNCYRTKQQKWPLLPFLNIFKKWCAWAISPKFIVSSANFGQQNFGDQEWEVEKILGDKLLPGKSAKHKFLVKWTG